MNESGRPWQDFISPDDPRYEKWLLLRAHLQLHESAALTEFLTDCQKDGNVKEEHVLKLLERRFDSAANAIIATVTGTVTAEQRAKDLEELLQRTLDDCETFLLRVEGAVGLAADNLKTQTELRLTTRLHFWRTEAFRLAFEDESSSKTSRSKTPHAFFVEKAHSGESMPTCATPESQFPNRARWLEARLDEREWNKHELQRYGGPEHRTTQKILDGSNIQQDVLRKVIVGLNSKLTHKGRYLPAIKESDIPND
jgi:hypothetical protein